ncbi:hypothetical protein NC652_029133 [Populus alba x Populus x berolinensis]|nr:hypothetical protein NC652_029133 [Populus alba x Populus x berolinensis]
MVTSHTALHKTRPQQATPQLLKEDLPLFKDVRKGKARMSANVGNKLH